MTEAQFAEIIKQFKTTFPKWADWFSAIADPEATAKSWFPAFEYTDFQACQRAIPLMRDGVDGYEPLPTYDFDKFPNILPRYARKWLWHNDQQAMEEKQRAEKPHYAGAFQHVTESDAVMSREFSRLMAAHDEIRRENPGRTFTPKEINDLALERIGGVRI